MEPLTPEQLEWVESRPPHVAAVIRERPPITCYRGARDRGHYWIVSYCEHEDDRVTLKLVHGTDSFLPGIGVFGVTPETLTLCDCGKWKEPTAEQAEETAAQIEVRRAYMTGGPNVG